MMTSRRDTLKHLVLLPLAVSFSPLTAAAAPVDGARKVVEDMIGAALAILRDPANKKDRTLRQNKLRTVADKSFDWEGMARGSLGPYWRDLNAEQRAEFVNVFKTLLANQYMDDVDRFQGTEQVKVVSAVPAGPLAVVKTVLITSSNERVPMDYTLHPAAGSWSIEDLAIEGVSMVGHYRDSFKRFLVNKSFDELLKLLKSKL